MFKKFLFLLFLIYFVNSCAVNQNNKTYCIDNSNFSIEVAGGNLSNLNKKIIMNSLVSESGINIDQDNKKSILLTIDMVRKASILSNNNTTNAENINFIVNYEIYDKNEKIVIDSGKIFVIDDINISNERFANYVFEENIINNFSKSLSVKLKNRIDLILKRNSCKDNKIS